MSERLGSANLVARRCHPISERAGDTGTVAQVAFLLAVRGGTISTTVCTALAQFLGLSPSIFAPWNSYSSPITLRAVAVVAASLVGAPLPRLRAYTYSA